jgi:hypothetical protein
VQCFSALETGCCVPMVGGPRGTSYSDIVLTPLHCVGGVSPELYFVRLAHLGFSYVGGLVSPAGCRGCLEARVMVCVKTSLSVVLYTWTGTIYASFGFLYSWVPYL